MYNEKQDNQGAAMLVFFIVCCIGAWGFSQLDLSVLAHNVAMFWGIK